MITASHLPFNRNGFKFTTASATFDKKQITELLKRAAKVRGRLHHGEAAQRRRRCSSCRAGASGRQHMQLQSCCSQPPQMLPSDIGTCACRWRPSGTPHMRAGLEQHLCRLASLQG